MKGRGRGGHPPRRWPRCCRARRRERRGEGMPLPHRLQNRRVADTKSNVFFSFGCPFPTHSHAHAHKTYTHKHAHWHRTKQAALALCPSRQAGLLFLPARLACSLLPTLQRHTKTTALPRHPLVQTQAHAAGTVAKLSPLPGLACRVY